MGVPQLLGERSAGCQPISRRIERQSLDCNGSQLTGVIICHGDAKLNGCTVVDSLTVEGTLEAQDCCINGLVIRGVTSSLRDTRVTEVDVQAPLDPNEQQVLTLGGKTKIAVFTNTVSVVVQVEGAGVEVEGIRLEAGSYMVDVPPDAELDPTADTETVDCPCCIDADVPAPDGCVCTEVCTTDDDQVDYSALDPSALPSICPPADSDVDTATGLLAEVTVDLKNPDAKISAVVGPGTSVGAEPVVPAITPPTAHMASPAERASAGGWFAQHPWVMPVCCGAAAACAAGMLYYWCR
ncbi:MAG: hypothetical protein M1549_03170 [Candidatus Dependentiae bacterium]|nr:hypothetical protein [Candidatus Dependentiae bacterium]